MNTLQQMSAKAKELGCIPGENAKQWRKRDPEAAHKFACWLIHNESAVVAQLSGAVKEAQRLGVT